MAKITLTEEEEIMYLRELDKIQDMMPDLEIQILAHPMPYNGQSFHADNSTGSEFRTLDRKSVV